MDPDTVSVSSIDFANFAPIDADDQQPELTRDLLEREATVVRHTVI